MCRVAFLRLAVTVGVLSSAIWRKPSVAAQSAKALYRPSILPKCIAKTYLPLTPLPQFLGYSLHIMTSSPPSQLLRHLLKSSLCESLLAPSQALLKSADLIFAGFDELVNIQFAMLESLGTRLGGDVTSVADFGALVETRSLCGMRLGGG